MNNRWTNIKNKVKIYLMDETPSEKEIEDALRTLAKKHPDLSEDSEGYERTFRELRNELVPKIDEGITLTDQNST